MTETAFHRDNHFVPCVYLKGWTGTDGKVSTYRILVSHGNVPLWRSYSPDSIAYYSHLYTQTVSGVEKDDFEKWLGREFETPAEEPLRKARSDARLTPDDWKRLVRFLAAQDVRTPAWFIQQANRLDDNLQNWMATTLQNSISKAEEAVKTGHPLKVQTLPSAEREGLPLRVTVKRNPAGGGEIGAEILRGRQLWIWTIKRHLTKSVGALLKHHWTILLPAKGLKWFTSDNPVVRLNYKSPTDYNFGGGWGSLGTEIFLPLDPEHLLFTHIGQRPPQRGERLTQTQTEMIRRFLAEHAWRMIFTTEPIDDVQLLRPRTVNREEFQHERDQWARWHQQQTAAELETSSSSLSTELQSRQLKKTQN
jgi:hypothetical protein